MSKLIEVSELVYTYRVGSANEVRALKKIDLDVYKGEFLTITGQNGSGKSTLARHFNGLLIPKSGKVLVGGLSTALNQHIPTIRKTVGMVFQNPDNQLIATIVEEDVAFGPENLGLPPEEIRARVAQSLSQVGMEDYRLHAPHLLSGGQKQRVAIAGILAMGPQYLVLDEPTAMLDPQGRKEVMNTVLRLNRESAITVVWITHHMEEAVNAHRIVVMDQGKVALEGSPSEVFRRAEFLESLALAVPTITRLGQMLAADGFTLPPAVLSVEEMVSLLCP